MIHRVRPVLEVHILEVVVKADQEVIAEVGSIQEDTPKVQVDPSHGVEVDLLKKVGLAPDPNHQNQKSTMLWIFSVFISHQFNVSEERVLTTCIYNLSTDGV